EPVHGEPRGDRRLQESAPGRRARRRARRALLAARNLVRAGGGQAGRADGAAAVTLWRRILAEKRAAIVPLLLGLVANVVAYALWVYPLGVKSAGAQDRAAAAARGMQAAERDYEAARALVAGKSRAEQELSTFYDKVLPADQGSALRLTYATL